MTRRTRLATFLLAAAGLAVVLVHGLAGLPAFGHFHGVVGLTLNRVTVAQRHATDVITAINFDYRGLDTMGEEFILFSASIGLVILLREQRDESDAPDEPTPAPTDPAAADPLIAAIGRWALAPIVVLAVYVITHGQLTPGGGFQGGVILASSVVLMLATSGRRSMATVRAPAGMEVSEALGAGGYVAIGLAGLVAGLRFLSNFLPLGVTGSLLSSGTITSLSTVVGLEVGGAIALVVAEFSGQLRLRDPES